MTLAQLNEHLDLVQQLQKTEELIQGLWDAAVPGAQKLDGMPHASGVSDKVGVLGAEIADMETQRDALKSQIVKFIVWEPHPAFVIQSGRRLDRQH